MYQIIQRNHGAYYDITRGKEVVGTIESCARANSFGTKSGSGWKVHGPIVAQFPELRYRKQTPQLAKAMVREILEVQ
jgi:hypothetical protein